MIEINNLVRNYKTKDSVVGALKGVSLRIEDGDIYGIIGMSGAGKSTLVRCINMLERPDGGEVVIDGQSLNSLSERELRKLRSKVTMIFQGFNLLMQQTCLQNVCFPLLLAGKDRESSRKRALELLDIVGLADRADSYPARLSGGQQQRVAIARALASDPKILLCDEATSALDPTTTNQILDLIRDINRRFNITVVIITHQMSVVESICNRVAILDGGEVMEEGLVSEVFSHPKSLAAKRLVFPEFDVSQSFVDGGQRILRVVFNGAKTTSQPLIASLAIEEGIAANIIYASLKNLNGATYGSILLGFDGDGDLGVAKNYFVQTSGVTCEEFDIYG